MDILSVRSLICAIHSGAVGLMCIANSSLYGFIYEQQRSWEPTYVSQENNTKYERTLF
jgi:hypothetical protein